MGVFVALLRGINVSGKNVIRMADLKRLLERIGLADVGTYLQSGNVVFKAAGRDTLKLARLIQDGIAKEFKYQVEVLVLFAKDIHGITESNPLISGAVDEKLYHATFLFRPVLAKAFQQITLPAQSGEKAILKGQVVLLYCPHGYGRTKLNNTFFEKKLNVSATTRNWRTVQALKEMTA